MAFQNVVLIDSQQNIHRAEWNAGPEDFSGPGKKYRLQKRTLHGGLREGAEVLDIDNGMLRFSIVPTRGMNIWKAWLGETEIGFQSPVQGPVHPQFVPIGEASGLGWLDGFDELISRCGLESNGAPEYDDAGRLKYPLHGRIANKPAHYLEAGVNNETGEIRIVGIVDEARFHFCRLRLKSTVLTKIGERGFRVIDEVTNLSGGPGEMQLLYHVNFSQPLLGQGAKIIAPVREMAPKDSVTAANLANWDIFDAPTAGFAEQVYFFNLHSSQEGNTKVLLQNPAEDFGVSVGFPVAQLPSFVLWKDTLPVEDGYVTGLEPATNFPNARSFEKSQGRVVSLAPGETKRFELSLAVHPDAVSVRKAVEEIASIQGDRMPKIFAQPRAGWTPLPGA